MKHKHYKWCSSRVASVTWLSILVQCLVKFTNIWTFWYTSYNLKRLIFGPSLRMPGHDIVLALVGIGGGRSDSETGVFPNHLVFSSLYH
jgi:hypothetical protein